jgi:ERCC4-related helicase
MDTIPNGSMVVGDSGTFVKHNNAWLKMDFKTDQNNIVSIRVNGEWIELMQQKEMNKDEWVREYIEEIEDKITCVNQWYDKANNRLEESTPGSEIHEYFRKMKQNRILEKPKLEHIKGILKDYLEDKRQAGIYRDHVENLEKEEKAFNKEYRAFLTRREK